MENGIESDVDNKIMKATSALPEAYNTSKNRETTTL